MEEEKQHEAATQPATEVSADGQPMPAAEPLQDESPECDSNEPTAAPASEADPVEEDSSREPGADGPSIELPEDALIADDRDPVSDAEETEDADRESGDNAELSGPQDTAPGEDELSSETSINAFELIGSTEAQATEAETDAATLKAVLEAIVYVLPEPVPAALIAAALNQPVERVESLIKDLMDDTAKADRGVFVREVAGGYQVASKPEHHEAIRNFVKNLKQPLKLSGAALETLAVIAYKQPVTAPEIMEIRGVQGVGVLKTLLDRKLITTAGRKNVIGKPILYKTTKEFLTQFGLNRLSELPTLKEFEEIRRQSISDDEVEERPEADASAPLLAQAAALDQAGGDAESQSVDAVTASGVETNQQPIDESGAPPKAESANETEPETESESEDTHA